MTSRHGRHPGEWITTVRASPPPALHCSPAARAGHTAARAGLTLPAAARSRA